MYIFPSWWWQMYRVGSTASALSSSGLPRSKFLSVCVREAQERPSQCEAQCEARRAGQCDAGHVNGREQAKDTLESEVWRSS